MVYSLSCQQSRLCWLRSPISSPMHFQTQKFSAWRTTFGDPWELMLSEWKSPLDPSQLTYKVKMPCVRGAAYQRTQTLSHQHNDRFYPCEAPCLRIFQHIYLRLQVLSFWVVLNMSGSPFDLKIITPVQLRNVVFLAFKLLFFFSFTFLTHSILSKYFIVKCLNNNINCFVSVSVDLLY